MTAAGPSPLAPGTAIAPGYAVVDHLARGHSLDTYDAWSEERACRCVIKALRPDRREDEGARRRLRQEGRLACELNHPHIVRGYELVRRPDPLAILETLDGETLEHLIANRRQRLPLIDIYYLGLHLCSAMHYLHAAGWIHLDLKPANVISELGRAKVIDLSLARHPGRGKRGIGTARYLAPEQARGGPVGPATDVWGIGMILWETAAATNPFEQRRNGTRYPQLESRAPALAAQRRIPGELDALVGASLDPDPAARPTVGELSTGLDRLAL